MIALSVLDRSQRAVRGTRGPAGAAGRFARRGTALGLAALLVGAVSALAAAHFRPGAVYTGRSVSCVQGGVPGTTCTFKFRASADGRALKFVGETVVDGWGCGAGGGEALLGGTLKYATPIPLVSLRPDGSLHGTISWVFRPSGAPAEHHTTTVTGHLSLGGRAARITFHDSGTRACATQPVTITEVGSAQGGPH